MKRNPRNKKKKIEYERIGKSVREETGLHFAAEILFVGACFSLLLAMCGEATLIPWSLFGVSAFAGLAFLRQRWQKKQLLRLCLITAGFLILAGILLLSNLQNGMALILNHLYAIGESAQAYLYDRPDVTVTTHAQENRAMHVAVIWSSLAAGSILGLLAPKWRLMACTGLLAAIFGCFAFIGLVPMTLPMGLVLLGGILIAVRGSLRSSLPLLIILALIFSALLTINPGESTTVSRADEQLRDYLATSTVRIEGMQVPKQDNMSVNEDKDSQGGAADQNNSQNFLHHKLGYILGLMLLVALILFVPAFIHDRLEKKRRRNRAGIDSPDPADAIRAMFPYAVRWLRADGLKVQNNTFVSLRPDIRTRFTEDFAVRYDEMLHLWREAAYSNHSLAENDRSRMDDFMNETIRIVRARSDWKNKLRIRFVQAL